MLVIPAIEIKNEHCLRTVLSDVSAESIYPRDPVAMALLWRKENAKTLHISDLNGLYAGRLPNVELVFKTVKSVEIPFELLSRFSTVKECRKWLDGGVYRLVLHDLILREPEGVRELLAQYGAGRLVAGVITRGGCITRTWRSVEEVDAVEFGLCAKEMGFRRLFFTDRDYEGVLHGPNYEQVARVAMECKMPVVAAGGIATVEHLWRLQEMESLGVDSVVIGRAFYENKFPCQLLWRDVEAERRNALLEGEVSTSGLSCNR